MDVLAEALRIAVGFFRWEFFVTPSRRALSCHDVGRRSTDLTQRTHCT